MIYNFAQNKIPCRHFKHCGGYVFGETLMIENRRSYKLECEKCGSVAIESIVNIADQRSDDDMITKIISEWAK